MADDSDLLTAPVVRGKSLVKKLRKEMSHERRTQRKLEHGRPYMYPESGDNRMSYNFGDEVEEPLPLRVSSGIQEPLPLRVSSGIQEPLPHNEHESSMTRAAGRRRHNRRAYKRSMYDAESVEMLELRTPMAGSQAGSLVQGRSSQYGTLESHNRSHGSSINQNETGQYTKINRAHVASQNAHRGQSGVNDMKSVRWSQDPTIPDNDELTVNSDGRPEQTTRSQVTGRQQRHNNSQDPWTISQGRDTYFVYGSSLRANNPPEEAPGCCGWWDEMWAPYGGFRRITSPYIFATLSLLFIANIFFITAFVTNHWGILHVVHSGQQTQHVPMVEHKPALRFNNTSYMKWIWNAWNGIPNDVYYDTEQEMEPSEDAPPETQSIEVIPEAENNNILHVHVVNRMKKAGDTSEHWKFGLWQCCRSTDGLCLGPRFAPFYGVTRTFSVLTLFLQILCFAWLMGHTLEKLLDYDTCTMSCLISMCYISAIFTAVTVICFGSLWPSEFAHEYDGTNPELSFSFYMAAMSIPLTLGAAVCSTIDLKTGLDEIKDKEKFYSDPDNFNENLMSDIPTDNISRPKHQKKKRTGQSQYLYESQA